jgi:hypothetical protein
MGFINKVLRSNGSVFLKWVFCSLAALLTFMLLSFSISAIELTPFATSNQSPLIQISGLPSAEPGNLVEEDHYAVRMSLDVASNYTSEYNDIESVLLDGETYRTNFNLRYGINGRFEMGLDITCIGHTGGYLDNFINNFHDIFDLPDDGRSEAPLNRLVYSYERNGIRLVNLTDSANGLGDLRLNAAWQLYRETGSRPEAMALRLSLKLPTGDSDKLLGSGGIDLALSLNGQREFLPENSRLAVFASIGALGMSKGDVLKKQRRNLAVFGTLGFGWAVNDWMALKAQFDGHTSMYKDSNFAEVDSGSVQLVLGASFQVSEHTTFDLGLSEDLWVYTAPDAVFHFALRKTF